MTERHGAIIVAITRLVPIFPFNLLNYGFGLTRVRFGTYLLWSFLCMLPGIALYVVGADALTRGLAEGGSVGQLLAALLGDRRPAPRSSSPGPRRPRRTRIRHEPGGSG
jgi:uncharacterized membrane protein YdjX (TVP38/TMEM64 family)